MLRRCCLCFDALDGEIDAAYSFVFAKKFRDVKHVGALAFAYYRKTERIHDIAEVIALGGDPVEHYRFGRRAAEVVDAAQRFDQLAHDAGSVLAPAFLDVLGVVAVGLLEEELGLVPEITHKVDASFYKTAGACDVVVTEIIGVDAVVAEYWLEQLCESVVGYLLKILVIEPAALLVIEACA